MNIRTGIDFEKLLDAADYAASLSSKNPLGRIRHVERKDKKGMENEKVDDRYLLQLSQH